MDTTALQRLDTYPYRHRLADVMVAPVITATRDQTLADAARAMAEHNIGALVVIDDEGRSIGIISERDLVRAMARPGSVASGSTVASVMSRPVEGLPADAFLFRAMARLQRRGFRHLLVLDHASRPIGMVSARTLLSHRASTALMIGDEIDEATQADALRAAHDRLPGLARALQAEDVPASRIAAVIAAITRDITARAAALTLEEMMRSGKGAAPAPWCLLVLGSAGRGESLLAPDQDNALVYDGDPATCEPWFAAFADHLNGLIDRAGIPLCKGNVMARNPSFRLSLRGWHDRIARWVSEADPQSLLEADIFFDFVGVAGERQLAGRLRAMANEMVSASPAFLRLLATQTEAVRSPFDLLGRLRSTDGRLDLKLHGTLPIVAAARTIALACRADETGSTERLATAAGRGLIGREDADRLEAARQEIVTVLLRAQLGDLAEGRPVGSSVVVRALKRNERDRLKQALREIEGLPLLVQDALTQSRPA